MNDKDLFLLSYISILLSAFSASLICYITGEGFSSPYYAGIFIITIVISVFFHFKPKLYIFIIGSILTQHFLLQSFLPFKFKDLLLNMFALGTSAIAGIIVHNLIYNLTEEIKTLRGFIPICAKCKKIRDYKGFWNQIEKYFQVHADMQFTHSLCPDCADEFDKRVSNTKK